MRSAARRMRGRLRRTAGWRINRAPSPVLAAALPWLSIMAFSVLGHMVLVASAPMLPPLAFMVLLAWRMLRPGMLPVCAGFPLGAFDDLYSGQPFGSAIVLWSAAMLAMELVDSRLRWRGFLGDWVVASALVSAYLVAAAGFAGLAGAPATLAVIVPQIVVSLVVHPVVTRVVAMLDQVRLMPLKVLD